MSHNNAKRNVQNVYDQLVSCMDTLNDALRSVEKQENAQHIKDTLGAVDNAIERANHALANYKE